ncbi:MULTISPECIES: MFS transporter [Amycolatopsis]|uniref:MFS transporter n=1 Tax=Amycolatopsis bullii TaxID=941987 RepID=A0ABQ3KHH1_9PSEU|nr:MFS transporter [Amycolatopsis bullii]GHG14529.1 MFS transporter [Amycolatopsis bullii]
MTLSQPPAGNPAATADPAAGLPPSRPAGAGRKYVWLMVLGIFGSYVALVTPIAISLAIRVQQLAPGREEILGYILGAGAAASALASPFIGMLSDRTRSRLGRRRPYIIGCTVLGTFALVVLAAAPNVWVLALGWILVQLGWGNVGVVLVYTQADRLSAEQRGRVAGLAGSTQMIAPIVGSLIASALVWNNFLLFLVPGAVGVVFAALYVIRVNDDDSRNLPAGDRLSVGAVLRNLVFSPRRYPSFAWNWLGRLLFNTGVTFATTFTTFFFAARLGKKVEEIAGFVAILSAAGVLAAALGALGGGWLSDRLRRRRQFVLVAGVLFGAGTLTQAFGPSLAVLFAGSLMTSVGIGAFSAVDQALVLDVLPERDTDAGRFLGINGYSTAIPQAIAPLLASPILLIGTTGTDKNYLLLFVIAAACAVLGGLIVITKVRVVPSPSATPEATA